MNLPKCIAQRIIEVIIKNHWVIYKLIAIFITKYWWAGNQVGKSQGYYTQLLAGEFIGKTNGITNITQK